jgi:hypothetical protein
MKITIPSTIEGRKLYQSNGKFNLKPGVTILVGCNGTGKSQFLYRLGQYLKKKNIKYYNYDNYTDGGHVAMDKALFHGNMKLLATSAFTSEGEKISIFLGEEVEKIGKWCKDNENEKKLFILLDAVDSGYSIDNILVLKDLFKIILKTNQDKEIYIIAAANSYELAANNNCLYTFDGKYRKFNNYEEYREFILQSYQDKVNSYPEVKPKKEKEEKIKKDEENTETNTVNIFDCHKYVNIFDNILDDFPESNSAYSYTDCYNYNISTIDIKNK